MNNTTHKQFKKDYKLRFDEALKSLASIDMVAHNEKREDGWYVVRQRYAFRIKELDLSYTKKIKAISEICNHSIELNKPLQLEYRIEKYAIRIKKDAQSEYVPLTEWKTLLEIKP